MELAGIYPSLPEACDNAPMAEIEMTAGGASATAGAGGAIDRAHLWRMTFGDAVLEREVLGLFDRQAEAMLGRLPAAEGPALSELAHAVKGSARGVGAWRVAGAAAEVESGGHGSLPALLAALADARAEVARILRPWLDLNAGCAGFDEGEPI